MSRNNQYSIVTRTANTAKTTNAPAVAVEVAPIAEPEPIAPVDHVSAIRSQLQAKLDALVKEYGSKESELRAVEDELSALSAKIGDLESSLHVLTDHIALHLRDNAA